MNIPQLEEQLDVAKSELARILNAARTTNNIQECLAAFDAVAAAQRALAEARGDEYAIPHDIGFVPEAAVSEPVLLQTDDAAILTFSAMRKMADGRREDAGYAIVEFDLCSLTKFGYPNDEAISGHPLHERGLGAYGVYEVRNSRWVRLQTEQNRIAFPKTRDSTQRHFIFTFHERTFECIARGLHATLSTKPYAEVFEEVRRRVFQRGHGT